MSDLLNADIVGRNQARASKLIEDSKSWLTAFHGTKTNFLDFDVTKTDAEGLYGPGHYFTNNAEKIASGYAGSYHKYEPHQSKFFRSEAQAQKHMANIRKTTRGSEAYTANSDMFDVVDHSKERLPGSHSAELIKRGRPVELEYHALAKDSYHPNVRKVMLDIKNPFDIQGTYDSSEVSSKLESLGIKDAFKTTETNVFGMPNAMKKELKGSELYSRLTRIASDRAHAPFLSKQNKKYTNALLAEMGYDGITHKGGGIVQKETSHQVHIAFRDDQVKPFWETQTAIEEAKAVVKPARSVFNDTAKIAIEATGNTAKRSVMNSKSMLGALVSVFRR